MKAGKPISFGAKILHLILILVFLFSTSTFAGVTHEAFTILSPVENGEYTVNEPLSISATADKFIVEYINGFRASNMNYVIMEISKDDVVKKTSVLRFSTVSGMGYYGVGSTMTSTYTPDETGTYTVRVGFCQYDRGERAVQTGYDKITELNYLGTYQFSVTEAKPDNAKAEDKDAGKNNQSGQQEGSSKASNSSETSHTAGNIAYQLKDGTAAVSAPVSKNTAKLTIPAAVRVDGKSIPVTSIAPNAFKGMKNLTSVTIGKNVKKIGKNAFSGCKKLKKITFKTKKLTTKSVGANAFKGIYKKAVVKCPKVKKAAYKKFLLKKGMKKTMTFK